MMEQIGPKRLDTLLAIADPPAGVAEAPPRATPRRVGRTADRHRDAESPGGLAVSRGGKDESMRSPAPGRETELPFRRSRPRMKTGCKPGRTRGRRSVPAGKAHRGRDGAALPGHPDRPVWEGQGNVMASTPAAPADTEALDALLAECELAARRARLRTTSSGARAKSWACSWPAQQWNARRAIEDLASLSRAPAAAARRRGRGRVLRVGLGDGGGRSAQFPTAWRGRLVTRELEV